MQALLESVDRGSIDALDEAEASVAVRSSASASAEDSVGTGFAGGYETFVGLRGLAQVELQWRRCWASAFSARALRYAWKNGISALAVELVTVCNALLTGISRPRGLGDCAYGRTAWRARVRKRARSALPRD